MKISLYFKPLIIKASYFFLIALFMAGTPKVADAGFFSGISDFFTGGKAQANETSTLIPPSDDNCQNIAVLSTGSVNPDIKNSEGLIDPIIEQGGSFIYNEGLSEMYSATAGLEKSPLSDQISIYIVKTGDTLSEIADTFGISTNTLRWENNISGQTISVGQKLNILPVTGVKHIVKSGDTISKIALKYEAEDEDILIYNGISKGEGLKVGDIVFVPNGIKVVVVAKPSTSTSKVPASNTKVDSGYYLRPVSGRVTSPYGSRRGGFHPGVDLAGVKGITPILAAADGVIVKVVKGCVEGKKSCGGGYGNYIDIVHPNGTMTRYGHMAKVSVSLGESVEKGEPIGTLGNTGSSTGPHLHFEIINANGSKMRPAI